MNGWTFDTEQSLYAQICIMVIPMLCRSLRIHTFELNDQFASDAIITCLISLTRLTELDLSVPFTSARQIMRLPNLESLKLAVFKTIRQFASSTNLLWESIRLTQLTISRAPIRPVPRLSLYPNLQVRRHNQGVCVCAASCWSLEWQSTYLRNPMRPIIVCPKLCLINSFDACR